MVVAEERPDQVRGGQSDERDRTGDGHRGPGEQDDGQAADHPDPGHRHAERLGALVAERQRVERGRDGEGGDQAERQERQHRREGVQVPSGDRPGQPEPRLVQGAVAGQHQRGGPRGEHHREHGAAEGEPDRVEVPAVARHGVCGHGRHRRSGEGEPHVLDRAGQLEGVDRGDHGEARAGVDAEGDRRGERVAGDALGDRPGDAERGPDREADEGARHPKTRHHIRVAAVLTAGQGADHGPQRDGAGAEREAQRDAQRQQAEPGDQHQGEPGR